MGSDARSGSPLAGLAVLRQAAERMRPLLRAMLWLCLLAITYLALTPQPDAPGLGWDKLNHVAAFAVLALLAELGWPGRALLPWRLGLLLAYGAGLELVQGMIGYREGSALDLLADGVGLILYQGVSWPLGWMFSRQSGQ